MEQTKKNILAFIESGKEGDTVDFKRQYYHNAKKSDLIKDILSFANASSSEDKYIIFGVSDDTRNIVGISENSIPDISEINQLIRTYCDPFIEIRIEEFIVDDKRIAAIIVKNSNMQKPYVVAKDYSYSNKTYLYAGDIYVRKSANNFRALRNDIEEIYRTRLYFDILSPNNQISIGNIEMVGAKQLTARIPISLINATDNSFVFNKIKLKWIYPDSNTGSKVCYIEDDKTYFKQSPSTIEKSPFVLQAKSQVQKTLYTIISKEFCEVIKNRANICQELKIEIAFYDARGVEHKTSFVADNILWE